MQGVLVAIEGIDGSGKTTQATLLADWLRRMGLEHVRTKEPTNGPWGQKIRQSKTQGRLEPAAELEAFLNDRREHVAQLINPALERGAVVIVDRYYYSTAAYQGAKGHDARELLRLNREFAPRPDLVVVLDVDPKIGLQRINARGDEQDAFETVDQLTKARSIFASLDEPHVLRLDATQSIEQIHAAIIAALAEGPLAQRLRR